MDEVSAVLGAAFIDNPNSLAIWRRQGQAEENKQAAIFRLLKLERPYARVLVARSGDDIVGALNMAPWPKCQITGADKLRFSPRILQIIGSGVLRGVMGRAGAVVEQWRRHDPQHPHWHLGPVGVRPDQQGRGVGAELMRHFCQILDDEGIGGYLETDRPGNVPFYEKFGFEVVDEAELIGVKNWFMWREPNAKRSG